MIVSAHQPNYLPYLGFFDKISKSDVFIIHDDVQFNKKDFQHRNKIRTYDNWKWLTVPVIKKENILIKDVLIKGDENGNKPAWNVGHLREIEANYKKTPYYESYIDDLKLIYNKKYTYLAELNVAIIEYLIKSFEIEIDLIYASDFGFTTKSSQKLADMVYELGGNTYLSGIGGFNYIEESIFGDIKVLYQNFEHPIHTQRYPKFEKNMAAIDALFNVGKLPI